MKNANKTPKYTVDDFFKKVNSSYQIKYLIGFIFFVGVFLLTFVGMFPNRIDLEVGQIATENIIAPRRIVDERMTEALRNQAESTTSPVYDYIPSAEKKTYEDLDSLYTTLINVNEKLLTEEKATSLNEVYSLSFTYDDYITLINLSKSEITSMKNAIKDLLQNAYIKEAKNDELEMVKKSISIEVEKLDYSKTEKDLINQISSSLIRPNMMYNESATKIAIEASRDSVYEVVYEAGQTIINKGEIISKNELQLLKDNGLMKLGLWFEPSSTVGSTAIILIILILYASYIKVYHKEIFASNKMLLLIALQFLIIIALGQVGSYFSVYLVPVSALTMVFSVIFSSRFAIQSNIFLLLFCSVCLQLDIDSIIYLAISGYIGIICMRNVDSRTAMFKSGLLIGMVNVVMILFTDILRSIVSIRIITDIFYGLGNGLICAVLSIIFLMTWEGVFNILSPFKLLEMSSPNDPLIQKLINEAPGTYHHSLIVSNMAETASKRIGSNQLLARVGAYYHDIGKAEKAIFFKENQSEESNPHDFISAEASAKIIKNHVTDGLYLAEKHRIPEEIIEFIITHHGTSEMTYFKAKAEKDGYTGDENFYYDGRLPKTKETSIVMLADSIEAAVRSLPSHEIEKIENMINYIIDKKTNEGQLVESNLSFKELQMVKTAFIDVLRGVYHSRVQYPNKKTESEA